MNRVSGQWFWDNPGVRISSESDRDNASGPDVYTNLQGTNE